MEGIGSRLGRASSRYGPAATVFNGPVRKWKKKWVLASSSSGSGVTYQPSSQSQSNNGQKLLLCRWTPIPPTTSTESDGATVTTDEPPRRKFRYTPIAVLEQKNAGLKNVKDEVRMKEIDQSAVKIATVRNGTQGELNVNEVFKDETQEKSKILNSPRDAHRNNLDLALCLNGQNQKQKQKQNQDSGGKSS